MKDPLQLNITALLAALQESSQVGVRHTSFMTYPASAGKGVKAQRRAALKKIAHKRARRLGHA